MIPTNEPIARWEYSHRVRYYDVDAMGRVHHAAYLKFLEDARTEMLREFGITYKDIEGSGVYMPVIDAHLLYKSPLFYDEAATIELLFFDEPGVRMPLYSRIKNSQGQLVLEAKIVLCFIDQKTSRPCRVPELMKIFYRNITQNYR